jgi:branched-chain amino acid transport system substrate-binding protein
MLQTLFTTKEATMKHRFFPTRRRVLQGIAGVAAAGILATPAFAADPLKIGLILPLTGPFASTGKQIEAACRLYIAKNGDTVAGRKVELIVKDDTGLAPETTKRIAQELVVQDKVTVLAGFGLTPLALAAAPVATEAKVPMIVMAAATGMIPTRSPFIVRTGFTLPQVTAPIAEWALKNKIKRVVTMVTDYGPGLDAEKTFVTVFKAGGGEIVESIKTPLRNPDYAPFLQRAKDAKPDALFVFVPSGEGLAVMKQFDERGLKQAGIRLIGTGDVTDDDLLESMGAPAVGIITSFHYSAAHDSPENKAYVDAFMKANNGMRPNFHSLGGYDGMHLIYEAVKKAGPRCHGRAAGGGDEGPEVGEPARTDVDRPGDPADRPERLPARSEDGQRQALERRVRQVREREGSGLNESPPPPAGCAGGSSR